MHKSLKKIASIAVAILIFAPGSTQAALTVGATSITTDSTFSLQGGNVGVGTTPAQLLEIGSTAAANTQLTIRNTNAGDYDPQIGFQIVDGTNRYTMGIDDSDGDRFKISLSNVLGTSDIFSIEGATTKDVGIGLSNPAATLHVHDGDQSLSIILLSNSVTGSVGGGLSIIMDSNNASIVNSQNGDLSILSYSGGIKISQDGYLGVGDLAGGDPTDVLDIVSDNIRVRNSKAPASNATCNQGEISWGADYIYVCISDNTWRRSTLSAY